MALAKHTQSLKTLNLAHNQLGDEGVGRIAESMLANGCGSIQNLDFTNNGISDKSGIKFA
jgi:hypothetical protein